MLYFVGCASLNNNKRYGKKLGLICLYLQEVFFFRWIHSWVFECYGSQFRQPSINLMNMLTQANPLLCLCFVSLAWHSVCLSTCMQLRSSFLSGLYKPVWHLMFYKVKQTKFPFKDSIILHSLSVSYFF